MPFNFFGSKSKPTAPPDLQTLAKWFHGTDVAWVESMLTGFLAEFLAQLKTDGIVARLGVDAGLNDDGISMALGEVIRLTTGGGPGAVPPRELTPAEIQVAQEAYDEIRNVRDDDVLATSAVQAAMMNGIRAWYGGAFDHAIAVATHIVDDIDWRAGEAYRVRAFARIALGQYVESVADLEKALEVQPTIRGAKEPLAAIKKLLAASQVP